ARLVRDGLRAAKLDHYQAAEALSVSTRSIGRYVAGDTHPPRRALELLASAVARHDAALASQLAKAGGIVTQGPGVVPAAAPVTLAVSLASLVEIVVCAAADAIDAPPRTARAALAAALLSARSLGLSSDAIIAALVPRK
ncbi:MAG TPA: hypothetical protein VHS09_08370, partial [Polyangiaceae bacterium]|nr:hypothetical protein [Polyangiaceae bacterium]